jgi:putative exosortase-associated protein (TIGR04073 family)
MSKMLRTIAFCATALLFTGSGAEAADDYGDAVKLKLASGFSNLFLGLVEVPKNIINTSNQVNLLFGVTGGTVKGTAHALGRTLSGIADVFTAPIGNKPITNPPFVWQNWYTDTTYGPYFPVDKKTSPPVAGQVPSAPKPPVASAPHSGMR